jgi:hypothetical protein
MRVLSHLAVEAPGSQQRGVQGFNRSLNPTGISDRALTNAMRVLSHLAVEAPGAQQRGVQQVRAVGGADENHARVRREACPTATQQWRIVLGFGTARQRMALGTMDEIPNCFIAVRPPPPL